MSKQKKQKNQQSLNLGIIYPQAAGLDVGSMNMVVSYPGPDGVQTVREYGAYTQDLHQMAKDLQQAGVTNVGMEATGVYWMSVYEVLEEYGFTVTLVNARHYKNVDGQKTDVQDCQWLQQLHAHGLLRASHIAQEQYRELRTYIHERNVLQNQKSDTLNRIHKVLTQMNIKFQHVISDIEGVTGMQVIRRIADGVTGVENLLAGIKTDRLKVSKEDLTKSLEGIFKLQYQTDLKNHLIAYDFYKKQMLAYEHLVKDVLKKMLPSNDAQQQIKEKTGPTAEHFVSWLNLAARPKKSGGKVLGHQKRFTNNTATQAFRMAAQTMWQHKGSLGNLYRRLSHTKGSKKAIKAVARRLAVIFYNMVKKQISYDPKKVVADEEKIRAKKIARLQKEAEMSL